MARRTYPIYLLVVAHLFVLPVSVTGKGKPKKPSETEKFKRYPMTASELPAKDELKALQKEVDKLIEKSDLPDESVGIYIEDIYSSRILYSKNAEETFNPASNMKLLTSAAALETFGPFKTFQTSILTSKEQKLDKTIDGDIFLRGQGEAFLLFEDFINWAASLKQKGVERIEGNLIVDDNVFKGSYLPPGYGQKEEDDAYRSAIGAVSVNFNAVTAIIEPSKSAGDAPNVRLYPPNQHIRIENKAETVNGYARRLTSEAIDEAQGTVIRIDGSVGKEANPVRTRKRINNPPLFAGSVLAEALDMVGIELTGDVKLGETPDSSKILIQHESQPLSYILLAMNKWSNNFMAEQLLRAIGAAHESPSTWASSKRTVEKILSGFDLEPDKFVYFNGSGLYDGNKVSPRQFVRFLTAMRHHRYYAEFYSSLAISGRDGTLEERLDEPDLRDRVRGKTGTLDKTSALTGYIHTHSNRLLAYSILLNDTPRRGWRYRQLQNKILAKFVRLGSKDKRVEKESEPKEAQKKKGSQPGG